MGKGKQYIDFYVSTDLPHLDQAVSEAARKRMCSKNKWLRDAVLAALPGPLKRFAMGKTKRRGGKPRQRRSVWLESAS